MDDGQFDRIAKAMAGTGSRRGMLLRGLSAGTAGLLSALSARPGAAQEVCAEGQTVCGGACVDLQNDARNCGSCGHGCFGVPGPGQASSGPCAGGVCQLVCLQDFAECGGVCVDLGVDTANCGACGNACADGEACIGATCAAPETAACGEGLANCGGICVDISFDADHCGGCAGNGGAYCPSRQCADGACVPCEETGRAFCPGQGIGNFCTDLNNNDANCGGCGNVCEAGTVCILGACQAPNAGPIYPPDETPSGPTAEPDETAPAAIAVDEPTSTPNPTETARGTATGEPSATAAPTTTPAGPEISGGVVSDTGATTMPPPALAGSTETPTTERRPSADPSGTEAIQAGGRDVTTATDDSGRRCPANDEDANELLARRWYEAIVGGDIRALDGLIAADSTLHAAPFPDARGAAEVKRTLGLLRAGFPDRRSRLEQVVTKGDDVVVRWTATGTHEGEYLGIAATGREATWTGIDIFRIDCGGVIEVWSEADGIGLLRQLGALPAATPTP